MQTYNSPSWATFKSFVSSRNLSIQWIDLGDNYWLKAFDGPFALEYMMFKDSGSDQTDFETNFQSTGNQTLDIKAGPNRPVRVSASPQPVSTIEHWKGYQITVPIGQTSGYVDISFPSTVYLHGGYIVSADVDLDDYVTLDILVAANNATYISGLISNAYLIPNQPVSFESAESMSFPTSLKLRVTLNLGAIDLNEVHANVLVDYFI